MPATNCWAAAAARRQPLYLTSWRRRAFAARRLHAVLALSGVAKSGKDLMGLGSYEYDLCGKDTASRVKETRHSGSDTNGAVGAHIVCPSADSGVRAAAEEAGSMCKRQDASPFLVEDSPC